MFSSQVLAGAAKRILDNVSLPVRFPSYSEEPFWAEPLTITRARPLPPGAGWVNFFDVPDKQFMTKVIYAYILTPWNEGQVQFRWLKDGHLLYPDSFILPVAVERHIDRILASPYPARFRETFVIAKHDILLRIQAQNLSQDIQLIFGAMIGWYYPSLTGPDEITRDQGIDDAVRQV